MRPLIAVMHSMQLYRESLCLIVEDRQFAVSQSVGSLASVTLDSAHPSCPDLVLCGIQDCHDAEDIFQALALHLSTSSKPHVVLLGGNLTPQQMGLAAAVGVKAILSNDISSEVLQRSIELVMLGQTIYPGMTTAGTAARDADGSKTDSADVARFDRMTAWAKAPAAQPVPPFQHKPRVSVPSEREAQVLQALMIGASNKQIARDLQVTEATVKVHVKALLRKIRVNNRTQAAVWGIENGYQILAQVIDEEFVPRELLPIVGPVGCTASRAPRSDRAMLA